jgi:hypothetical protein
MPYFRSFVRSCFQPALPISALNGFCTLQKIAAKLSLAPEASFSSQPFGVWLKQWIILHRLAADKQLFF